MMVVYLLSVLPKVLLALALIALIMLLFYLVNLRRALHDDASFFCSMRQPGEPWRQGIAKYTFDTLEWKPIHSLRVAPQYYWDRHLLELTRANRYFDHQGRSWNKVTVNVSGQTYELYVTAAEFAGLVSWVEAAPPKEDAGDVI